MGECTVFQPLDDEVTVWYRMFLSVPGKLKHWNFTKLYPLQRLAASTRQFAATKFIPLCSADNSDQYPPKLLPFWSIWSLIQLNKWDLAYRRFRLFLFRCFWISLPVRSNLHWKSEARWKNRILSWTDLLSRRIFRNKSVMVLWRGNLSNLFHFIDYTPFNAIMISSPSGTH